MSPKTDEPKKSFLDCLSNFMSDSSGLAPEDIQEALTQEGLDVISLDKRVEKLVREESKKRRLNWRDRAREKREKIERLLRSKGITASATGLRDKVIGILAGDYGPAGLSYAETYFRKKEVCSEEDLESLIEDLEDLELLDKFSGQEEK
jgi:hypothetical protein